MARCDSLCSVSTEQGLYSECLVYQQKSPRIEVQRKMPFEANVEKTGFKTGAAFRPHREYGTNYHQLADSIQPFF